jgi:hypothetical protein
VEKIGLACERYREPIEPTMELQTSKLGSERRGWSIGSAGSRIDTDKSSGLPKPSKQDEGTQATSSLQQDLLKVKPVAIDSAVDCLRKRLSRDHHGWVQSYHFGPDSEFFLLLSDAPSY